MFDPVQTGHEADVIIPPPRHKFVNTMRGSRFSEISFDDLPLDFECKLEDQQDDRRGSKIVDEVVSVEINDTKDVSPFTIRHKEAKRHPGSTFDVSKYTELQNSERLLFEKWREHKLINSGGLLLCRNVLNL